MSNTLIDQHCQAIDSGTPSLTTDAIKPLLAQLHPDWHLGENSNSIVRDYKFANYYETIAFVNASAWIAHQEDHHPDLTVGYNRCLARYSTHSVGGLSMNDFICAAKLDALVHTK